jgi:hypothetical protein
MAVLGTNGKIVLNRSAPAPVAVNVTALNQDKNIISLTTTGFRSGDLVEVASTNNWPNANLYSDPLIPSYANIFDYQDYAEMVGYSTPYPAGLLRPFRWLSTENNDVLTTEDGNVFAIQSDADTTPYRNRLYVHVDALNRLSFYRTRAAALEGANDATREDIDQSDFALDPSGQIELRLVNEWKLEACLQSWSLNLNASEIDTTGLGDQFFDGVKSLVQGGGTFDFLIEREECDTRNTAIVSRSEYANAYVFFGVEENITYNNAAVSGSSAGTTAYDNAEVTPAPAAFTLDATALATLGTSNVLRLLLNTNEQSEAEAEFWMIDGDAQDRTSYTGVLLPGDLYYKAQIMLTSSAVSVRATDVITGSANFVTVREVQLREG